MTADDVREIDECLTTNGMRYNAGAERFETLPRADKDPSPIEWIDPLAAVVRHEKMSQPSG